jgi:hypothetical protein
VGAGGFGYYVPALRAGNSEWPACEAQGVLEGKGQVTGTLTALRELLSTPGFAVLLGLLLGVAIIAPLFWSSRLLTVENADIGLYVVMGVIFGGLILSLGLMWGYHYVTPEGFMWFGPSVVAGFIVALGALAAVLAMRLLKSDGGAAEAASADEKRR